MIIKQNRPPLFLSLGHARSGPLPVAIANPSRVRRGAVRAYPLRIMLRHEVVNDKLGMEALAITYCPLCGTAMVFDSAIYGRDLSFGVSGLLYQSDVLLYDRYDRETSSLLSRLGMKAISGNLANTALELIPSEILSWKAWRESHPAGLDLSRDTGFSRSGGAIPYVKAIGLPGRHSIPKPNSGFLGPRLNLAQP